MFIDIALASAVPKALRGIAGILPFAAIIFGILYCFAGYRLFRFFIALSGFVVGAAVGGAVAYAATRGDGGPVMAAGLVAGMLGAALALALHYLGVFLVGAGAGALLAVGVMKVSGASAEPIALVLVGVFSGLFAIALEKFMVIVLTSLAGSYAIVAGAIILVPQAFANKPVFFLAGWVVIAVLGMAVQYGTAPNVEEPSEPASAPIPSPSAHRGNTVAVGGRDYRRLTGEDGPAFCVGCRTVSVKSVLLYCSETATYYHEGCLPK